MACTSWAAREQRPGLGGAARRLPFPWSWLILRSMSQHMKNAAALVAAVLALVTTPARAAGDGRLLAMEAAEPIDHPVLGLQRTALPIAAGFALDTSLLGDLALALNLGVRWGAAFGDHRVVVGARYTHFVGAGVYSSIINGQQPVVKRFAPSLSGPTLYAAYGLELGALTLHAEGRYARLYYDSAGVNVAAALHLTPGWSVVGEVGYRFLGVPPLHAALGIRFVGERLSFSLGAAYVGIDDPLLPSIPVLPAVDLSWSFS